MARSGNTADGSFMRLYHFITGRNEAKQKIAMTTPVMKLCFEELENPQEDPLSIA
jgi:hypothetical protein